MSDHFKVKSRSKEYEVSFVSDFTVPLRELAGDGAFFLIDKGVAAAYKGRLEGILPPERLIEIEASEEKKTLEFCASLIEELVEKKIRRGCLLVSIGGGVVQDITAFIATVLYRGLDWVFFPTTLLAQGDSCIGSKSSINLGAYKNLLGTFNPPESIYIDTGFLETLDEGDIRSGIGEMLHFYFYGGSELAKSLMDEYDEIVADRSRLRRYINGSLSIKKEVIEKDEFDRGVRNLFNYGHTFGHAVETVTSYAVSHGEAVTLGMDMANYISMRLGHLSAEDFDSMHAVLEKNIPDFVVGTAELDRYMEALSRDKKNEGGRLGCILTKGPGSMMKVQLLMDDELRSLILSYGEKARAAR